MCMTPARTPAASPIPQQARKGLAVPVQRSPERPSGRSGVRRWPAGLLACGLLTSFPNLAAAVTVIINDRCPGGGGGGGGGGGQPCSQVFIQVGSPGGTIDVVTFDVPGAIAGTGTPITGLPSLGVILRARRTNNPQAGPMTATLSADSSQPLANGPHEIPFSEFGWQSSDEDIPSGTFDGSVSQVLLQFEASREITVTQTFTYQNSLLLEPGTYQGRVTYTLALP
jgi:hypothetical protein